MEQYELHHHSGCGTKLIQTHNTSVIMSSSAVAISIFIGSTADGSPSVIESDLGPGCSLHYEDTDSLLAPPPNRKDMVLGY